MKQLYKKMALLLCAGCVYAGVNGQPAKYTQTVNSAGGTKTINNNTYEWAVGETVVFTGTASSIVVTQGVLQPANWGMNISNTSFVTDNMTVYPVPAKDVVTLQYNFPQNGKLQYHLKDITGKVLLQEDITIKGEGKATFSMAHLPNAIYILQVNFTSDSNTTSSAVYKLEKLN